MRTRIASIISDAADEAVARGDIALPSSGMPDVMVELPRKAAFGDYSTNIAMLLAAGGKRPPREIASLIAPIIEGSPLVERCEIAGPGFINLFLKKSYWTTVLTDILSEGDEYGRSTVGEGRRVQVEFVSANPTGPLHIGHGRGAAVGDALANILEAAGYDVNREFYINDVGRQIEVLGRSVLLRYKELLGQDIELPEDSYKGEYIRDVAAEFREKHGDRYAGVSEEEAIEEFKSFASAVLLDRIKEDLRDFAIEFDTWYSERSLVEGGQIDETIAELRERGHIYESDGATWFRTSTFGDDKDRVLIKADGSRTYFASDIAYHRDKMERGFSTLVNVWGADHHGYEGRIRALIRALDHDDSILRIIFIQLVALLRAGKPVAMGKREGEFVTLRQVMDEVGADACRFFFLMRKADAQLDFDLDLAKSQASENPVYYVQYCHARIQSIFDYASECGVDAPDEADPELLGRLDSTDDIELIKLLGGFGEIVEKSAAEMEPHRVTFYLMELAGAFHPYYNRNRIVTDDTALTGARLLLCRAVRTVAANGLRLLGVSTPDKM